MSNYTIAVNWSGKDGLSDSDAGKVISGSDFNTEFTTARTAINSKADLNGNASESFTLDNGTVAGTLTVGETLTVTGIPTIPTASAGTNTTQAATTAFVTAAVAAITPAFINNLVYPVGSIYTNMAVATNPASLLGVGTWVAYAEGRVLVGKQASGTFDALDESLGAETHTLTIAEMPAHTHDTTAHQQVNPDAANASSFAGSGGSGNAQINTGSTGGGGAHSNLQPSVTVHMWKRTA